MTPFEYVIVLISIILGLGITTILTGVAEIIKHSRPASWFAPYIIWILLIFLLHFQDWWLSYQLRFVTSWSLHFFLLIILYPINLYILAHLLFPASSQLGFNSKAFFLQNHHRFFIGASVLVILSVLQNIGLSSRPWWTQVPHMIVLAILLTMIWSRTQRAAVHLIVAVGLLVLMIAGFALDQENLTIQ